MEKILKSRIFTFILGVIIFGSIGVVSASVLYQANEIGYTPKDSTWEVDNVKDAIDDLYTKSNISSSNLIINKNEYVSSISFQPSDEYRYYILTNVIWYGTSTRYADCINYSNINTIENATYIDIGATGRNTSSSSGASRSFLIIPSANKENITVNFVSGVDALSIYGIK